MTDINTLEFINKVIQNIPNDWTRLTTHRLDIYDEKQAKTQFLNQFNDLFQSGEVSTSNLESLPTAYDYIRLGHPLSCVLEWTLARLNKLDDEQIISFDSVTIPLLSILRKNLLNNKSTRILYAGDLPTAFDAEVLRKVYGYHFELQQIAASNNITPFNGNTVFIESEHDFKPLNNIKNIDFHVTLHGDLGSVLYILDDDHKNYVSDIQHVRRRETVAMTPENALVALKSLTSSRNHNEVTNTRKQDKISVAQNIQHITGSPTKPLMASSGLSIQYAIMMGLIQDAMDNYPGKAIKFLVPPNCYGGTNDQARRVADCLDLVEIVDLPVDGDNDMVQSIHTVLDQVASQDAIPFIIAEIPTNPRVEVPDLKSLQQALSKERFTASGAVAVDPVFILDQTFCPNVAFLGDGEILSEVRAISYASGSKFPSGGKCTAGYCIGNQKTISLIETIEQHLILCDNEATNLQMNILAQQLPSMNQRIKDAYVNTRKFVDFISEHLPEAKINFVSEELAEQGFTPSVFSLDLPTKGDSAVAKEAYKRELNHRLINMMITEIPQESKYCVSYGQLKGVYWTIPATSTQGTTKEGDKDYIARVSLSPSMDLEKHQQIFLDFVATL
jgi:cystathionine beta-lyase/cystathionine gamma-synthase